MTSEKAIKMLEYIKDTGNGESEYKNNAQGIALDMAINILEEIEKCDETSATRCFTCINEIKRRYER